MMKINFNKIINFKHNNMRRTTKRKRKNINSSSANSHKRTLNQQLDDVATKRIRRPSSKQWQRWIDDITFIRSKSKINLKISTTINNKSPTSK